MSFLFLIENLSNKDHGLHLGVDDMLYYLQDFSLLFLGLWLHRNLHGKMVSFCYFMWMNYCLTKFLRLYLLYKILFWGQTTWSSQYSNYTNMTCHYYHPNEFRLISIIGSKSLSINLFSVVSENRHNMATLPHLSIKLI